MNDQQYEWISKRAYALWEQAGHPAGCDEMHWRQAVSERDHLERTQASIDGREVLERNPDPSSADSVVADNTILVVEDEPALRYETVEKLEDAGYHAFEAGNADEAMVLFKGRAFGTLITDINMPGQLDGLALVDRVRLLWPATKVIITSGLVRLRQNDLAPGVTFLEKPMRFNQLLGLLGSRNPAVG
jgi:CheY-like chemotaxis protein